jgi:hypothetical protein
MKLAALQSALQAHVLAGGTPPPTLAGELAGPAEERLRIYADGYRLRIVGALKETFPALAARLGDETWGALIVDFATALPSRHRSLRDYGGELGPWLAADAADAPGSELALAAELAHLEWALAAVFDAAPAEPTTVAELASLPAADWPGLRFAAVPSLRRLTLTMNAPEAWRAALADGPRPPPEVRGRTEWLAWREGLESRFRPLEPVEAAAFDECIGGRAFEAVCARVAEAADDAAAARAASWLKGWIDAGLLLRTR